MRLIFILIFIFAITIYFFSHRYLIKLINKALTFYPKTAKWLKINLILLAILYPLSRIIAKLGFNPFFIQLLNGIGLLYLAYFIYIVLFVGIITFIRIIDYFLNFMPAKIKTPGHPVQVVTLISIFFLSSFIILLGYQNNNLPQISRVKITIDGKKQPLDKIKIVGIADLHLDFFTKTSKIKKMVQLINKEKPDIILLAGDVVDEFFSPDREATFINCLQKLSAKMGVYAVTGNHEFMHDERQAVTFLSNANITLLRDRAVKIADSFYLVGREDRIVNIWSNKKRKELSFLVKNINHSYPIILMDHQPFGLNEAVINGIDFQFSGHTHNGQFFPINILLKQLYEKSWGYLKKENSHFYITCGVGTWGPPVKTAGISEIVVIDMEFK